MSEMRGVLSQTASRLFAAAGGREAALAAEGGAWPETLWREITKAGLAQASIPEERGGPGADLGDVMAILRAAGRAAVPVPLAETLLAAWLLSASGLAVPEGPLTVAPVLRGDALELEPTGNGWRLSGTAAAVPFARNAVAIAVTAGAHVASVPRAKLGIAPGASVAGEPRDAVTFPDIALPADAVAPGPDRDALWRRGALSRIAQMAGALEEVLAITVGYAKEREQFGRPIGKFQAVQQQVAVLAANAAAAGVAADAAIAAAERGDATFEIAAAKTRIGEAATVAAGIAHQVHGAMGFTREYPLHLRTRRLWSWRDEFGDETYWAGWLGRLAASEGGARLWSLVADGARPQALT